MGSKYKSVRRQRSAAEIIKLLEEYENNVGVTVKQYCAIIGVSDAAFYRWRKMYGSKGYREQSKTGFIELVASQSSSAPQTLFAEVKGIKIYQPVAAEYLKALAL